MKFTSLFLLFFLVLVVHGQRRTTPKTVTDSESSRSPPVRGRGRSRFVATPEHLEEIEAVKSTSESSSRKVIVPRRRVTETTGDRKISPRLTTASSLKSSYEVEEYVNESPIESFRRTSKPRVLTETHFEAANVHKKSSLDLIPTDIPSALFKSTESVANNALLPESSSVSSEEETSQFIDTTLKTNSLDSGENTVTEQYKGDFTKTVPISTSPKSTDIKKVQNGARRSGTRNRFENLGTSNPTTQSARPRGRTRPTRKPDESSITPAPARNSQRGPRRRVESSTPLFESAKGGPSVFTAEPVHYESRSRLGRKIEASAPEKITIDLSSTRNAESNRRRTVTSSLVTTRKPTGDFGRRSSSRSSFRETSTTLPTIPPRQNRFKDVVPPLIDEQKLEVLPLFENEPRTVPPVNRGRSRTQIIKKVVEPSTKSDKSQENKLQDTKKTSRTPDKFNKSLRGRVTTTKNLKTSTETTRPSTVTRDVSRSRSRGRTVSTAKETFQTSATENNEVKFTKPLQVSAPISVSVKSETSTEPIVNKSEASKKTAQVKESIIVSQSITEVTSKRTIPRRRNNDIKVKIDKPKVSVSQVISRGKKKADIKLPNKKSKYDSSEEIDESDNYPEAFKALIHAKKNKEESRPSLLLPLNLKTDAPGNKNVVTSSSILPSLVMVSSTEFSTKEIEDEDNELEPKSKVTSRTPTSPRTTGTPRTTTTPRTATFRSTTTPRSTTTARTTTSKTIASSTSRFTTRASTSRTTLSTTTPATKTPVTRVNRGRPLVTKASETTNSIRRQTPSSRKPSKVVRSTAQPPSTTPLPGETKVDSLLRNTVGLPGRGSYDRKKFQDEGDKGVKDVEDHILLSTRIPKPSIYKKSSRPNSKYRSDIALRGTVIRSTTTPPAYIPTIPSVYVPTIPTFTPPSRSTVYTFPGAKDGIEAISFDDPVNNTIPSANLVKGDYISSSENSIYPLVKDGTTEKAVSIIERIINSITAINATTPSSEQTKTATTGITTESSSAILKLATKKSSKFDKTKTDSTSQTLPVGTVVQTTEKPTTIIEKILSSLSAIQATDDTNSIQVGKDFNTISASSTTPIPSVTKFSTSRSTLPAQISTSLNPLSVLDEISPEQALEKRTIGELLNILNGLLSTTETPKNLVVVTPKASSFVPNLKNNGLSTIGVSSTIPFTTTSSLETNSPTKNKIDYTSIPLSIPSSNSVTSGDSVPDLFTTILKGFTAPPATSTENIRANTIESISTTVQIPTITVEPQTSSTLSPTPKSNFNINARLQTTSIPQTTTQLIATTEPIITTTELPITTPESTTLSTEIPSENTITTRKIESTTFPTVSEAGLDSSTNTISLYSLLSTLPTFQKFEVSPGSVSIFSANDISNAITADDLLSTVTIASRSNFDNTATTQSSSTTESIVTTFEPTTLSSTEEFTEGATTLTVPQDSITTLRSGGSTKKSVTFNNTNGSSNMTNDSSLNINRSGRLLNKVQDPIQNSIDISTPSTTTSTTPDYFIFAVLNNNTILRKKPPTLPNKETPFLIVGLYPNNTIVRKFPNGTLVPMEQIIRVRGFDTRENPPPLPEITSNQVTNDPGSSQDNSIFKTVEQNTVPLLEANALSLEPTASTSTIPNPGTLAPSTTQAPAISTSTVPSTSGTTLRYTSTTPFVNTASPSSTTTFVPSTKERVAYVTTSLPSTTTFIPSNTETVKIISTTQADTMPTESNTILSTTKGSSMTEGPSSTLPTLSEFLNGRTLEAFNSIVNSSSTNTNTEQPNYQTLQVNQYNQVLNIQDILKKNNENENVVFRWKPVMTTTNYDKVDMTTPKIQTTSAPTTGPTTILTTTLIPTTAKVPKTSTQAKPIPLLNRFNGDVTTTIKTTTTKLTTTSATTPTTTSKIVTTTTNVPRRGGMRFSDSIFTTEYPIRQTTPRLTSTPYPSSTYVPTILSTLFPALFDSVNRQPQFTTATPFTSGSTESLTETIAFAATTQQPTTITSTRRRRIPTTTLPPTTTTVRTTTTAPTTTTAMPTTTRPRTTTTEVPSTFTVLPITASTTKRSIAVTDLNTIAIPTTTPRLKLLTEEQKKNLETLAELEKEQAMLLRQLSLLTSLGFGGGVGGGGLGSNIPKLPNANSDLANRVIQLAVDRDKTKPTNQPETTTTQKPKSKKTKKTTTTSRTPTSIQDQIAKIEATRQPAPGSPSLDEVLKQYDLSGLSISETTPQTATTFGKSSDAVLAALLKEQGLAPTTPKSLEGVFEQATRRSKPKTTTLRPPGRLMQGLSWLMNVLAPPPVTTTKKPKSKSKPKKPKKPPVDQELLTNSPTHITPVVTSSPSSANSLSQDDIQKLIKQLEGLQKDPSKGALDLSQIKSLQNLINTDEGVQVITNGEHGTTSRRVSTRRPNTTTEKRKSRRLTTEAPEVSESNSVDEEEDEEFSSTTTRVRAPIGFRPVPGVDDNNSDPFIRGNLITAAVNVTRAISGFLGSALQGAAQSFQSLLGSGSRLAGSFAQGSSLLRQE